MSSSGRQLVHTHIFDAQLQKFDDQELICSVVEVVTWAIYRNPERGTPVPGTRLRAWPVYYRGTPHLIYYKISEKEIHLASIIERISDQDQ